MAHILIMPRQGNTVESCILVDWKVKEGDTVTEETLVCDVETDKAAFEVPAGVSGTVLKLLRAPGDDVPVLEPIAVIGAAGEEWRKKLGIRNQESGIKEESKENSDQRSELENEAGCQDAQITNNIPIPHSPSSISPRARNLLAKNSSSAIGIIGFGTGPGGRIIERDIKATLEGIPALSAAAKALNPTAIPAAGTGIGNRITKGDLASFIPDSAPPDSSTSNFQALNSPVSDSPTPGSPASDSIPDSPASDSITPDPPPPIPQCGIPPLPRPIKGIRKIISDRMLKSLAETAQFTLNTSVPVSRLQDIRLRMKNSAEDRGFSKITVNDFILFAVSRILPRFSYMNAHKIGDTMTVFDQVHLGLAVDTPRGLMVPVIRNANSLSLGQISSEAKRLIALCQNGTAKPEDLSGSTFSVTNLGSLGITSFTPILNIPEVAILGVCNIELKPVAPTPGSQLPAPPFFEPHIGFSLTINHQAVDGAPAARFLKALGEAIADIDLLLINEQGM